MPDPGPTTAPQASMDEIIEDLKKGIDVTSIDENLKLTPSQRFAKFISFMTFLEGVRKAGQKARGEA
ncbi:MAG: hypothetical protein H6839_12430 [Planctomycetes bacterium]|nr:hypothetical protein [Planctomycetota bacterium]